MFDISRQLAVQSWCYRAFKTPAELIPQIKAIGLSRVEMCGVQVNFDDPATHDAALAQFKNAGIQITSIGVQTFRGDARERGWFAFAKKAGASMIACSFTPAGLAAHIHGAEKLAEEFGLQLGIHNHGGYDWLGNEPMLKHVFSLTSPRVGLCLDTAWCLQAGHDPIKFAEQFNDRLHGVHIKDFIFDRAGKPEDVIVGTGNLKLKELMAIIEKTPHCKAVTLEYERDVENPGPKLKDCVEAVVQASRL